MFYYTAKYEKRCVADNTTKDMSFNNLLSYDNFIIFPCAVSGLHDSLE
jgi:hypothetical protein